MKTKTNPNPHKSPENYLPSGTTKRVRVLKLAIKQYIDDKLKTRSIKN